MTAFFGRVPLWPSITDMLDGSSDPAAPVVQLDANSLRALSHKLAPMILERVQRSHPTARATAREPVPATSQQAEDDNIALYPEHNDLTDSKWGHIRIDLRSYFRHYNFLLCEYPSDEWRQEGTPVHAPTPSHGLSQTPKAGCLNGTTGAGGRGS